jgi:tetratricopeptide (TPR) repeat protein
MPAIWVGLVGALIYLPTLSFGLVKYDDPWLVGQTPLLQHPSWQALSRIWLDLSSETRLLLGAEYLPVRDMSVMLDHALFGSWYGGHHLMSLLLYGLLCGLATLVIQRWLERRDLAWFAGLLFALHPLHVESAAWLSERKGLLAAVFVMFTALAFRRFLLRPSLLRWLPCATLLVLGIWSKALGITAVGFVAALAWFCPPVDERPRWAAWAAVLGLLVVGLLAMWPVWSVGNRLVLEGEHHAGGLWGTLWLTARVIFLYGRQFVLGADLGIQYAIDAAGLLQGLIGALLALGLLALALVGAARRWTVFGLAASCWWIFFLPVSQLFFPLQNVMADRYMLLALWPLCLLLAAGLHTIHLKPLRYILFGALALLAAGTTVLQTRAWSSSRALYHRALQADPGNIAAMIQLSQLHRTAGDLKGAQGWLERASKTHPNNSTVLLHRALLQLRMKRPDQAIQLLRRAVQIDPKADKARANLALLLHRGGTGRAEALRLARGAVTIRPLRPHNQRTLGVITLALGKTAEAEAAFRQALRLEPGNAQNHVNLAVVCLRLGHNAEARRRLVRALELDPRHKQARQLRSQLKR